MTPPIVGGRSSPGKQVLLGRADQLPLFPKSSLLPRHSAAAFLEFIHEESRAVRLARLTPDHVLPSSLGRRAGRRQERAASLPPLFFFFFFLTCHAIPFRPGRRRRFSGIRKIRIRR